MLDYLNHYFKLDNHLVESNFPKNKKYFNTDIFYDYSPMLELPLSIDDFKSTHKKNFGITSNVVLDYSKKIMEKPILKHTKIKKLLIHWTLLEKFF